MSTEAIPATNGMVAVRGGEIVVTDAEGGGSPAVVTASEGVRLLMGGQSDGTSLSVTSNSKVTVDVGSTEPSVVVDARLGDADMKAEITVLCQEGLRYELEDQDPARELVLTRKLVERIPAPQPTIPQALGALSHAGVSHGIDMAAVRAAVSEATGTACVVAKGSPATPPVDAEVHIPVEEKLNADRLFSVPSGTLLARRTPAVRGEDGTTVTGAVVSAAEPKDPQLEAGAGATATVDAEGAIEVRADVDGRPTIRGAVVGMEQTISFSGDVGVETGNVRVFGNLEISGNVLEGRTVWVKRDLSISGEIERATILAGGALSITGSCVHSRLRAGGPLAVYVRVLAAADGAAERFQEFAALTRQLVQAAADKGQEAPVGRVAFTVLQGRFIDLPGRIKDARELLEAHDAAEVGEHIVGAYEAAFRLTDGLGAHNIPSLAVLDSVSAALTAQTAYMQEAVAEPATMTVGYMQGCEIEASGSLVVTGGGTFNCEIFVGGDLVCAGDAATLRGGTAKVGGRVRVNEVGAPGGSKVHVHLDGKTTTPDRMTANVVHDGVVIACNGRNVEFETRRVNLSVGVDDENRVTHSSLSG